MPKLMHIADLHLGAALSSLPESAAASVREGLFGALARAVEVANDERVDALLISGDLFDTPTPPRSTAERAFELLGRAAMPVFIAPGNHDHIVPRSPYLMMALPQNLRVFRSEQIERIDCGAFVLYGAAFTGGSIARPLLEGFRANDDRPSVMMLHGDVAPTSIYHAIPAELIAASGVDYIALGHVHARSELQRSGGTAYAYHGCCAGHGFDETGDKGGYIVDIDGGGVSVRYVSLGARRFVAVESDEPTLPSGHEDELVKLTVVGEREPLDVAAVEQSLAGRAFFVKVVDHTRLPRRVWARSNDDTLAGAFLSALATERDNGADDELIELAARYGLAALDREEAPK